MDKNKVDIFTILSTKIEDFGFSTMVVDNCKTLEIETVSQLLERMQNPTPIFNYNFGQASLNEINQKLFEKGLDISKNIITSPFVKNFIANMKVMKN